MMIPSKVVPKSNFEKEKKVYTIKGGGGGGGGVSIKVQNFKLFSHIICGFFLSTCSQSGLLNPTHCFRYSSQGRRREAEHTCGYQTILSIASMIFGLKSYSSPFCELCNDTCIVVLQLKIKNIYIKNLLQLDGVIKVPTDATSV